MPEAPSATPTASSLPTVSVVIPAYNSVATLGRALDSVYAQTYANIIEIIVVDDGSRDDPAGFLRAHYPDVKYLQQSNTGAGGARNRGVSAARGDYAATLDADDAWQPHKLARQVEIVRDHPEIGLVLTRFTTCWPDGRRTPPPAVALAPVHMLGLADFLSSKFQLGTGIRSHTSTWLVSPRLWATVGGQPAWRRMQDWAFIVETLRLGHPVAVVMEPLMDYTYSLASNSHALSNADLQSLYDNLFGVYRSLRDEARQGAGQLEVPTAENILFEQGRFWALNHLRYGYLAGCRQALREALSCAVPRTRLLAPRMMLGGVTLLDWLVGRSPAVCSRAAAGLRRVEAAVRGR